MSKRINVLLLCTIVLFLAGCGGRDEVLVQMKGGRITLKDFNKELNKVAQNSYYRGFLSTPGGKQQFLEGLVNEKMLVIQARKEELHRAPEFVEMIKEAKARILMNAMVEELMQKHITVTEKEINDYYEQQKEEFLNPEQVEASHILLSSRADAEMVKGKLGETGDFEELAKQYSIDSMTAARGGSLGRFSKGDMVPGFENAAFSLKVGEISPIIKTQFGYHIIKLTNRIKMQEKTIENAKDEISELIQRNKYEEVLERYKRELKVNINQELLDSISSDIPGDAEVEEKGEGDEEKE